MEPLLLRQSLFQPHQVAQLRARFRVGFADDVAWDVLMPRARIAWCKCAHNNTKTANDVRRLLAMSSIQFLFLFVPVLELGNESVLCLQAELSLRDFAKCQLVPFLQDEDLLTHIQLQTQRHGQTQHPPKPVNPFKTLRKIVEGILGPGKEAEYVSLVLTDQFECIADVINADLDALKESPFDVKHAQQLYDAFQAIKNE